jgi:AraC family transcriptional regulator
MDMSNTIEPTLNSASGTIPWVNIPRVDIPWVKKDWLFQSSWCGITRWECSAGKPELSEERCQSWHVVGFVHSGAFVLHSQGRTAVIDATSVLFCNPGEPFRSTHPFGLCDHGSMIAVRREALLDLLALHDPAVRDRPDGLFQQPHVHGLFRAYLLQRLLVRRLGGAAAQEPLAIEEGVLKVLEEVAVGCRQAAARPVVCRETSRARRDYVEDVKALLQTRFRERLQLDDIARSLYVSAYHLCRLFREEVGVPIHRYLNRLRLREALGPITKGTSDLSELALGLGFSSHSHFTASFRKEFGVSPRAMKKLTTVRVSEMVRSLGL